MNTAGFMIDRTHALGLGKRSVPLCLFGTRQSGTLRLHTPARRHAELVQAFLRPYRAGRILHAFPGASPQAFVFWPFQGARSPIHRSADPPGFVAPKWAKDFSLGRSPRNITKSDQALKALQKKLRSAIYRYKELVQAFLRPYKAGRILHAFPGASPQAFVFWPFQGARSPIHRSADPPGFVAPKWAKDFSLGRSPRNITKSDQALKALQKKLRSAIYRYKELVQAFLRPYKAGRILHAFPGASPQAFVFWPFQGARSPIHRSADPPGFVAPKWAKDFSLGRSPRNITKSDQALKALQKKLRSAIYRGKELVQAFLRPYGAGRILHAFPGALPQAFAFWPFQGARSPIHRSADPPGFVAPKWAKDFSLGRSPRSITKSDQALKVLQKKFRLAIYRYKELVQAFLRPYKAGRILHAFPGASPQAFAFWPFQGARSPIHRSADPPGFVAPKWAKDFSLGRSPRSITKSDQALKVLQKKFRLAIYRYKELVQAFLRPYKAGRILHAFPGA